MTDKIEFDQNKIYTMEEAKEFIKKAKGPLGGLQFMARNSKGEQVLAVVHAELSKRGKVCATLKDLDGGPDHVREQSDWHQSLRAPKKSKNGAPEATNPGSQDKSE